jgi:hypothetical protein
MLFMYSTPTPPEDPGDYDCVINFNVSPIQINETRFIAGGEITHRVTIRKPSIVEILLCLECLVPGILAALQNGFWIAWAATKEIVSVSPCNQGIFFHFGLEGFFFHHLDDDVPELDRDHPGYERLLSLADVISEVEDRCFIPNIPVHAIYIRQSFTQRHMVRSLGYSRVLS